MADNQSDPGTVQAYLANGRVDNITSVDQANTQISNYTASAAQDKAIMDSAASSGGEVRNATARYHAAEFDIQQVEGAENELKLQQQAVTPAIPASPASAATPPTDNTGQLASALTSQMSAIEQSGTTAYVVQAGDTMTSIAQAQGISLPALEAANPQIPNPDEIITGNSVFIPQGGAISTDVAGGAGAMQQSPSPEDTVMANGVVEPGKNGFVYKTINMFRK